MPDPAPPDAFVKILGTSLAALMIVFAAVQLNDPDGIWWALVYAATAAAVGVAAWRAPWLRRTPGRVALGVFVAVLVALVVLRWPEQRGFWRKEIWWETETAREGMGLMIALLVSLVAGAVAFGRAGDGIER